MSERAVGLYLAGARVPRPAILPRLAAAVGVAPADLCTIERERLVHLRVRTGRSRAAMGRALGMAEATYRQLEITGRRGRLACARYDHARRTWIPWQAWASPVFDTTPERLLAAEGNTRDHWIAERDARWRRWREADPDRVDAIEEMGRRGRRLRGR